MAIAVVSYDGTLNARVYQSTAGLTSICPQVEVKDHSTIFEITSGQHYGYHYRFWLSRLGPLLFKFITMLG
jgi:hypothetical protein